MSGAITWSTAYAGQVYNRDKDNIPSVPRELLSNMNNTYSSSTDNGWHKTYNSSYDYWMSSTTDGG